MQTLSEFLKAELKRQGISQSEFARRAGLSKQKVSDLLKPVVRGAERELPTVGTLLKLAKVTNTDLASLVAMTVGDELSEQEREKLLIGWRIRQQPEHIQAAIEALIKIGSD